MSWSEDGPPTHILRAPVSSRRGVLAVTVAGLSALGGAVAGGLAALIAAAVLTPTEPLSAAQVALMAVQYGLVAGVGGAVFGTIVAFGALRRVPLGKLLLSTNVGLAAGLTAGWLGGPWAWHHLGFLGSVGFSAGALLAGALSRGAPISNSSPPFDSVPGGEAIASAPDAVGRPLEPGERLARPAGASTTSVAAAHRTSSAGIPRPPANER